jgi:large subunit ribosomal protein L11
LKKALGVEKGAGAAGHVPEMVLSREKLREIAELKARDLNAISLEGAEKIVAGTAHSMGIGVEIIDDKK